MDTLNAALLFKFFLIITFPIMDILLAKEDSICSPTQFLEVGTTGTVMCSFKEDFFAVLWYNASDSSSDLPILNYQDSQKTGNGYTSGEFDIHLDGSLIINHVSTRHNILFRAVYIRDESKDHIVYDIQVVTFVKPDFSFPVVNYCSSADRHCYVKVDKPIVKCSVRGVSPNVTTNFYIRTVLGDKSISSESVIVSDGGTYIAAVTTQDVFHYSSVLSLLVCRVNSPPGMLEHNESLILIQNNRTDLSAKAKLLKYIELNKTVRLSCSDQNIGFVVWTKGKFNQARDQETLLYAVFLGDGFTEKYDDDVFCAHGGSLTIQDVKIDHEGVYSCIYGDGLTDNVIAYHVVVIARSYPVIEQCHTQGQKYCRLEAHYNGSLTCTVTGIRPQAYLEFSTVGEEDGLLVAFSNRQSTVTIDGDLFDITITSLYQVSDTVSGTLTIECRVKDSTGILYGLAARIDLVLTKEQTDLTGNTKTSRFIRDAVLVTSAITVTLLIVLGGFVCQKIIRKKRPLMRENQSCEKIKTTDRRGQRDESIVSGSTLYDLFVQQAKEKYKDLYHSVQPVPHSYKLPFCVNNVFVETGINFLDSSEGEENAQWQDLDSYDRIFSDPRVKSSRIILEGGPGHGKSTIALQCVYDWCNAREISTLKNIKLLIFLRLRQLGNIKSIYKAIQQFVLPNDTSLTKKDIKEILNTSDSVIVILDGFDEYLHADDENADVTSIIDGNLFKEFCVIVTTRSSVLPKKYPSHTKRVRLTGFDEKARKQYLKKVVSEESEVVGNIEQCIRENPILTDLCQVPMLFVMFAHLSCKNVQIKNLQSVTILLDNMVSCFHAHMERKEENGNVRKWKPMKYNTDSKGISKAAFEALRKNNQRPVIETEELRKQIDEELFKQFKCMGILVEEEVADVMENSNNTEDCQCKKEVRFFHKLFCEWFAACYLSDYLEKNLDLDFNQLFQSFDPYFVQYLYRFVCRLNSRSAPHIIDYLKDKLPYESVIFCIHEYAGNDDSLVESVRYLCKETIVISGHDSSLLQRSSLKVLQIASTKNINISNMILHNCLEPACPPKEGITIQSGLTISSETPVETLFITVTNREMSEEEVLSLLKFAIKIHPLKCIAFGGFVPPWRIAYTGTLSSLKNINVAWRLFTDFPIYVLDHQSGLWQSKDDEEKLTEESFKKMKEKREKVVQRRPEEVNKKLINKERESLRKKNEEETNKDKPGETLITCF